MDMIFDDVKGYWKFVAINAPRYETRTKYLLRTTGPYATARYLRNRGYTAEQAVTLMYR